MTFKKSSYHQDIFSLRLLTDDLDITTKYKYIEKFYGKSILSSLSSLYWIDKLYCFNSFYKVQSAFSGIMIINKKVFKLKQLWNDNLGPYESEHVSLCTKFANVYINSNMNFQYDINIEGILYNEPYIFIPRDAGFFSVFNYLIGSILTGSRIYPYYNKHKILEKNKQLKHFSYLDDNIENSWFDFFKPIKYYDTDITHESNEIKLYNLTIGEYAEDEFKYPYKTRELYNLPNFKEWRIEVNKYFKKYIKPTQEIIDRSDIIISKFQNKNIIGVLVRHPAHNIEEDTPILFKNYFDKIDVILSEYPEALIYLVTDIDMALGAFMLKYNTKLLYDDNSQRLSHDNIIEWGHNKTKGNTDNIGFVNGIGYELQNVNISNMNTQNGKDMVTNVIVLSKCKWFIYPNSNISLAVSYFGPDVEMISATGLASSSSP
jgi:hypothetical protein